MSTDKPKPPVFSSLENANENTTAADPANLAEQPTPVEADKSATKYSSLFERP
ncbi:hypothetical protein [Nocardia sp. NPDC051570]|uniref:hypothetical protein n=1 Tax=Nocardia sp. NPDC051570 TaxID=3364324 RepID=UPI0037A4BED6